MEADTIWSEVVFSCPICQDVFSSPTSTPCGHSFCIACITKFWDEHVQCICPVCNETFHTRPALRVNNFILEMAAQFRRSVRVKEQPCVKPGEVPCGVCTGTPLKAVKSCLICLTSFCDTHLEPHQRAAGLKRHELVDPMDHLEDRVCTKHNRLLEHFCQTEQVCVCQLCTETDHRFHAVRTLKEEHEMKLAQLGKTLSEVQQMIQQRQRNIQEIKHTVEMCKDDAERDIAEGLQVLNALILCIKKCQRDFDQTVQEKLKSTEKQAEGLIKELEQEIEDLTKRISEVKRLSHTEEDHLHFLQTFSSLIQPPPTNRDWPTVEVRPMPPVETLRRTLEQLEETLSVEMRKLRNDELWRLQQYEVHMTLDPDTANPQLSLSDDRKQVHDGDEWAELPDTPARFSLYPYVLAEQSFSSGRFYFEVQAAGKSKWEIGVARESVNRIGRITATPEHGYWTISFKNNGFVVNSDTVVHLPARAKPQKVGVFVDYDEGLVSFYEVDARVHIYSATGCIFREPLYPILKPGFNNGGENTAPLIISPIVYQMADDIYRSLSQII